MDELKLFTLIARLGSFSATADVSGLSQSTVSKRIKKLEVNLNLLLLDRSKQGVVLTDVGEEFLRHCQTLLDNFDATLDFVQSSQSQPGGQLTLVMPPWLAMVIGGEFFASFQQQYPKVRITTLFTTKERIIGDENVDIYIGLLPPQEGQFKAHELVPVAVNFYASQSYLDAHGPIEHPRQLVEHRCLCYRNPFLKLHEWFWVDEQGQQHSIYVPSAFDFEYIAIGLDLARFGGGVIWSPEPILERVDTDNRLVAIFGDKYASRLQLTAAHPHHNVVPHKVRVFIEELRGYLTT